MGANFGVSAPTVIGGENTEIITLLLACKISESREVSSHSKTACGTV
jgi:hypothetical protein